MLELYTWGEALGLNSIDPKCSSIIAYLQLFVQEEWGVVECNNPNISPTGELPLLKDGLEWISGTNKIIKYLKKKGYDADENLSDKQKADSIANYTDKIRPLYAKLVSFPMSYFVSRQLRKNAKERLKKYNVATFRDFGVIVNNKDKMDKIIKDCYKVLQDKIDSNDYFFGNNLSTLDVFLYGYLAPQLYPDLQNQSLSTTITTQFPRLQQFCDRVKSNLSENNQKINKLPIPKIDLSTIFTTTTGSFRSPRSGSLIGLLVQQQHLLLAVLINLRNQRHKKSLKEKEI
ncbi:13515_t:CDS:2 [Entrophospora sp. SA101]|nr:13515_t:CDS:2 [Entrophospora sp. SA101]